MKRSLALLVVILALPSVTALAATTTSKSFVVRNWKAPLPADENIPPDLALSTPDLFAPASTEENEQKELEEQGEAVEQDDHSEPGEQSIPPAFTDVVETDGQPTTPIFTSSTDEGEQDEQAAPVDYHSGEIEEASSESAESEQGEEMEPEGEEQPIP